MKVVIDKNIPFINGVLEPYAEVVYMKGDMIDKQTVVDADALIVRTRTRCNADLLEGSSVKIVSTATIGFDHVDVPYLASQGIEFTTAAGCNAAGVLQYVMTALVWLHDNRKAFDVERPAGEESGDTGEDTGTVFNQNGKSVLHVGTSLFR